jgi:pilus assembly protein CpaF
MIRVVTPNVRPARRMRISVQAKGRVMIERSFEAGADVYVGRSDACHICLPVVNVSRRHLVLNLGDNGLTITDSSAAGTRIGEEHLHNQSCHLADPTVELRVGAYLLRVEIEQVGSPASPASPDRRRELHRKLIERLDLARNPQSKSADAELRRQVGEVLERLVEEEGVPVPERAKLIVEIADEALGLGPLEVLLKDPTVSEIMVVEPKVIYVERDGRLELTPYSFSDADALRATIERIVTPLGRRVDESSPLVDARLADGSRVNAVIPPLALRGPCLTIRKFRIGSLSLADLVGKGSLSAEMAEFLASAVKIRKNLVISGGTGSGKTTLLNLLSGNIPERERIVTIEDAAELSLQQEHVVSLESRPANLEGKGEVAIRDLVKNALRMRPDRIIVGECRGGEALDMLQAMNTGHEGSMTTTHANSPREAIGRLETLCLMSGVELPVSAVRRQIATSLHLVVQQSRLSDGSRKITRISEILGLDDHGEVDVRDLFEFREDGRQEDGRITGRFLATGYLPSFIEHLVRERGGQYAHA